MSTPDLTDPTPQFGTAEYIGKSGNDHCRFCQQPIGGSYYRINHAMACPCCAQRLHDEKARDTHGVFIRALFFGVGAAILGMILYATFAIVTGIVIGYASLAVGWMVGTAMMKGSAGVGGKRYQIAAVLLTYAAVSTAAIPIWIHYANERAQKQHTQHQQLQDEQRRLEAENGQQSSLPPPKPAHPHMGVGEWLVRVTLLGLASPFIELWSGGPSFSWIIGVVILLVGMRIAARLTVGKPIEIYGPFNDSPHAA
jgi:hypothetical protein